MTSETPQTQALLQQINEVLNKTNPRLPWVMSSDAVQQRQVLEQTRDYLLALQQHGNPEATIAEPGAAPASAAAMEASAQQVLQAVVQEMNYLRSNMMQPLRSDVELLRIQRDTLTQEIRQLEMQRQQYELPQQHPQYLTEFLQAAMTQMQERLLGQMTQLLATRPEQLTGSQPAGLLEGSAALSPAERLQHLQMLQTQSDQLMLRLDTTLRTVFESLQRNVQSYEDSLEDGLGRMHDMGQQGEAVFGAFVNRLGQILGREASSFLQSPRSVGEASPKENRPSLPGQTPTARDRQIDQLWQELNALDQTMLKRAVPGEPVPFDASSSGVTPPADLANLEELDRVLSQLDLAAVAEDEELVWLPEDQDFPAPPDSFASPDSTDPQTSRRTVETDPDSRGLRSAQVVSDQGTDQGTDRGIVDEELESAIDLLNQVTAEIPIDTRRQSGYALDLEPIPPVELGSGATSPSSDPTLIPHPDALYEDEFYQTAVDQPAASPATAFTDANALDANTQRLSEELEQSDATDLDTDLFAGLTEFQEPDEPVPPVAIDATSLPQSMESRLLQSPETLLPQDEALDALLDSEETLEEMESDADAAEPEIETIAALTDLLPAASPDPSPFFVEPPRLLDFTADAGDLQPDTVQQLSAELFNLEDAPSADLTDAAEQTAWTASDWQDSPVVEPASPTEGIEWSLTDIPSILLSQPFSGQMTAEDLLLIDGLLDDDPEADPDPPAQQFPPSPDLEAQSDEPADALLESTLEDWFSAVEAQPSVTPPTRSDPPNTAATPSSTSLTPEEFAADVVPDGDADANAADLDETDSLNAFTLDGLDSLFEGVPSIDAAPSATDTQTVTVDDVFGDWGNAAGPPASERDRPPDQPLPSSQRPQKKKFGSSESAS